MEWPLFYKVCKKDGETQLMSTYLVTLLLTIISKISWKFSKDIVLKYQYDYSLKEDILFTFYTFC